MKAIYADTLIIGSGLAGLMTAHTLSSDQHVILLTKGSWKSCNSYLAQGGLACVTHPEDSWLDHTNDTLIAGNYHNEETRVQALTKEGPSIFQKLLELGVPFDRSPNGEISRTREGGHHFSRIVHAGGDATGKVIMETLWSKLPPHIKVHQATQAVQLVVEEGICKGVWARDPEDQLVLYLAAHVILATGGIGQLYQPTTNAITITGDGIAMAYHAGAHCTDMEFIQFHPTLLNTDQISGALISEAVRGEGAVLVTKQGERLMQGIHPLMDLAPRDIVARTIYSRQLLGETIYLDIRPVHHFEERFPTITAICRRAGVDLEKGLIPISSGAHFIMGGIKTDDIGRTSLAHLYAIGETACSGVHGANRLASNSLLEAAGYALRLSKYLNQIDKQIPTLDPAKLEPAHDLIDSDTFLPSKLEIQAQVTEYLGILRESSNLQKMKAWLAPYIKSFPRISPRELTKAQNERFNMITVAWLMTLSMLERTESRGAHFRVDYPLENTQWLRKRLTRERGIIEHV
ncbi:L-aspartate oxidase [Pullulanibacillus sp. KACC 23026]|uniref:L-aspartate oxidase n=1 Tax=Pullulanibacillus sp. KACC 23026 TaxID=3028315 RepID=UPI0023B0FEF9|nr:L-aspartate oxidase [Pullulanibacillus sp. KACC 23026]WEG12340.1 L-aspartate oxidase [Pullulanibacillus sp. KACC 23026]